MEIPNPEEYQSIQRDTLPFSNDAIDESEEMRQHLAQEHGLPTSATWNEITTAKDISIRIKSAKALNLPENASWDQIHNQEGGRGSLVAQALILGLPKDVPYSEVLKAEEMKRRATRIKVAEEMRFNRAKKYKLLPKERSLDAKLLGVWRVDLHHLRWYN